MQTVLVVDDERDIARNLKEAISWGVPGVRVLTAVDGPSALAVLARERVDIVLSDQRMPGMEGVDLLVQARRLAPGADRMMLTAFPEQALVVRNVNEAKVVHFFTKPYRLADVIAVVSRRLEERRARWDGERRLAGALARATGRRRGRADVRSG